MSKIGYLLRVDCEILNMEFFFHKQYGISIPKRFPTSKSCCFKANEAIELKPKRMEYSNGTFATNGVFIFSAPEYFCLLHYYPYTGSQKKIKYT